MSTQKCVLIVDDSRISRMMTKSFIQKLQPDWQIEEASTGEESLLKLETIAGSGLPLVLMDVNMPGIGGVVAAERIREKYPTIQITLLTANVQDATRNKARHMGIGFLEKPITETRIHQLLTAWAN